MAVNIPALEALLPVPGVRLAVASGAVKAPGRNDLALLVFDEGASVAGVFTRNAFRAPPVDVAEERIRLGAVRALLINSGNANAATGRPGREDAEVLCAAAARALGIEERQVAPFSTGVIGERLPVQRMLPAVAACADTLAEDAWEAAVRAIMTTDTVPKAVSRTVGIDGSTVTITGIAKGSGMIKPDMATMLAYVCCDAQVSQPCLERLVRDVADESFNRITVDADTSTNDAFVLVATGQSPVFVETPDSEAYAALRSAVEAVAATLAQWIVRDGEGATKFVTVDVRGGANRRECLDVAYTVAESPLVKTAVFAGDPNWGRFCMAIGRAGVDDLDQARVDVWLEEVRVVHRGQKDADYTEEAGASVMARDELTIRIDLGRGSASARVWTTDLSYEYVRINAEYRS